jgi:hypothetical protein
MSWGRDRFIRAEEESTGEKAETEQAVDKKKEQTASDAREAVRALGRMSIGGGGEYRDAKE